MKWINNEGIKFDRGDYEGLMARYDDTDVWFCMRAMATQQTQKSSFKRLGEYFNAKQCEVRNMWDEDGNAVVTNIVCYSEIRSDDDVEYRFYRDTADGLKRIDV